VFVCSCVCVLTDCFLEADRPEAPKASANSDSAADSSTSCAAPSFEHSFTASDGSTHYILRPAHTSDAPAIEALHALALSDYGLSDLLWKVTDCSGWNRVLIATATASQHRHHLQPQLSSSASQHKTAESAAAVVALLICELWFAPSALNLYNTRPLHTLHVSSLAVHPAHRRQGLALRLLQAAVTWPFAGTLMPHPTHPQELRFETRASNTLAINFYCKHLHCKPLPALTAVDWYPQPSVAFLSREKAKRQPAAARRRDCTSLSFGCDLVAQPLVLPPASSGSSAASGASASAAARTSSSADSSASSLSPSSSSSSAAALNSTAQLKHSVPTSHKPKSKSMPHSKANRHHIFTES
jgi:ribosomal protein S18 acetylase RimI-like enzyme